MCLDFIKRIFLISSFFIVCTHLQAADHMSTAAPAINMSDYFKVVLGLVFVIGLFLGSTYLFKRYGNTSMAGRGQLKMVDGLHLGNRERLVLVELNNKQILLSVTPGHVNKLDMIDKPISSENSDA